MHTKEEIECAQKDCSVCLIKERIAPTWREALKEYLESQQFSSILKKLHSTSFYPKAEDVFRCIMYFESEKTKVVILGQDPYHGAGQAMGLSFSVPPGQKVPPSLQNIKKEILNSTGRSSQCVSNGSLVSWAEQGVLLLNAALTVEPGKAGSHSFLGWSALTDLIIREVEKRGGVVFMLWGKNAQEKKKIINAEKNLVLSAAHPSPLSAHRGFLGCNHFHLANEYLLAKNKKPIVW